MRHDRHYMDKCMATVQLGMTVKPVKTLSGIANGPKVVRLIQNGYVYLEGKGKKKLSIRPAAVRTFVSHYEWDGKPVYTGPSRKGVKNGQGKAKGKLGGYAPGKNPNSDNLSPLWKQIREAKDLYNALEARVSQLEDGLGVHRA